MLSLAVLQFVLLSLSSAFLQSNAIALEADVGTHLRKLKSKNIESLGKATDLIAQKEFIMALEMLKPLALNSQTSDYAHHLMGLALAGVQREKFIDEELNEAIAVGNQAIDHFKSASTVNPFSSLGKRSQRSWAEVELIQGEIQHQTGKNSNAQKLFEDGFQRLQQIGFLAFVRQESLATYVQLCLADPKPLCKSWVERLKKHADKSIVSEDDIQKLISDRAQTVATGEKPASTATYSVNLDTQALQKGLEQYAKGDFEDAYITLRDLLKSYPNTNSKLRVKFWMARSAQKTNHEIQAQTLYREIIRESPFTYYALLSSWFGSIDLSRMVSAEIPEMILEPSNAVPQDLVRMKRAESLIANNCYDLARLELKDLKLSEAQPNEFLIYLAYLNDRIGNHRTVFQIYGELTSRGYQGLFSSFGESLVFPRTFLKTVNPVAIKFGISPLIPLSIIKQESAFETEAASSASAFGLMQLIRPTARDLEPSIQLLQLIEPEKNINLGTKYIASLLKKYKGNLIHSLAAYNAGPGNSDRWQREIPSHLSPEEYIEFITFKETREYVQSIIRNIYWYNRMLKREVLSGIEQVIHAEKLSPEPL